MRVRHLPARLGERCLAFALLTTLGLTAVEASAQEEPRPSPTSQVESTPPADSTSAPEPTSPEGSACPDGDPVPVPAGPSDVARAAALSASLHAAHRFATGAGVTVAVIDTGITPHPLLPELVDAGTFLDPPFSPTGALTDCEGHGTAVASIIGLRTPASASSGRGGGSGEGRGEGGGERAGGGKSSGGDDVKKPVGVAPDVRLIAIKQSATKTGGTLDSLGHAINRALDEHADVINLSVSSCLSRTTTLAPGVLQEAIDRAEREGAVIVAAAGNIAGDCPADSISYPAYFPTVIAVSALNTPSVIAEYSLDLGGKRPVGAPGTASIAASTSGHGYATATDKTEFQGTSFAAPVITGFVALLKERYPHATPEELRALVYSAAHPVTGALDVQESVDKLEEEKQTARQPEPISATTTEEAGTWWPLAVLIGFALGGLIIAAARKPPQR